MKTILAALISACFASSALGGEFPRFKAQTIDRAAGEVCYALTVADVDGDGKPDVVAATEDALYWYANPTWDRRTILKGAIRPDLVCLQAHDIDGDGKADFAVGAGWGPLGLRGTETLEWVGRDHETGRWQAHPVAAVPSLHRVRFGDVFGTGRAQVVAAPLQGRGVKEPNWGDGPGVRVLVYPVPGRPASDPWEAEVADEGLHTAHGLQVADLDGDGKADVLVAAWEGVFVLRRDAKGHWSRERIGTGNQEAGASRGASEVALGRLADGRRYLATVEPWHGRQVVVYTPPASGRGLWERRVVREDVSGAHALWCADLDGDGGDDLAVARRDADHDLSRQPNAMGVLVFSPKSGRGPAPEFVEHVVDDGGIAAEDLVAADLDGDGRIDLVAGGRETHNVKIYWNRGTNR